jgi:hypothetical protein
LASPKKQDVPIIDKKKEAKRKKREAAVAANELRRSVRAKTAPALKDKIIDLTLHKKKRSEKESIRQ